MTRLLVVILLVLVVGGGWWLSHADPLMYYDSSIAIIKAREIIREQPEVVYDGREWGWNEVWEASLLNQYNDIEHPTLAWFEEQNPIVYPLSERDIGVLWIGRPGCELQTDTHLKLGYEPRLVDGNGKQCLAWWEILIRIEVESFKFISVELREIGVGTGVNF